MRLRHIPGAEEMIADSPHVVQKPEEQKGGWNRIFGNNNPICIEVGMGKGKFIMELALENPAVNYIGIERYPTVLLKGVQRWMETELPNVYFMCIDAKQLEEIFAPEEVDKIYLNFSDPWPKDRHAKRRLTSPQFMRIYDKVLLKNGSVEFKTDNRDLFDYSLLSIPEGGWKIVDYTFDLHHSDMVTGNVMTEYEEKFSSEGKPICKLTAVR
ncbi:MAG: tRNA (guanosine(46)-N7)-methyltransferase TrmB [Clostridium sp.]